MTEPTMTEGLRAAIRAAKLAIFVINKHVAMPNDSWASGFKNDLATAEAALAAQQDGAWQPISSCPVGKRVMFWWRPIDNNPYAETTVTGSLCEGEFDGQWWNDQRAEYQSAWHLTRWRELPAPPTT